MNQSTAGKGQEDFAYCMRFSRRVQPDQPARGTREELDNG